jgi:hypothetical protein
MIGWLQPWALWGLAVLAIPLAIHLLRTRHARRIAFPTIRFVPPSRTAAVRLRPPSDLLLMAARMGIVALAVIAAAQPIWLTSARLSAWNARVARAVVVDTSESLSMPRAEGPTAAEQARAIADAEQKGDLVWRLDHPDLREGIRRAVAWVRAAPPARREIVVISDFHLGSISGDVPDDVPEDVGLRFLRVQGAVESRFIDGVALLPTPGRIDRSQRVELSPEGTQVTLLTRDPLPGARPSAAIPGLRLVHPGAQSDSDRLVATLAAAGTAAPDAGRSIAVRFAPIGEADELHPPTMRWMVDTLLDLERSPELARLARGLHAMPLTESASSAVLLRDREGRPLVRAGALDREFVVDVASPITSYFAAALTRKVLSALRGTPERSEQEVLRIADRVLSSWSRVPGPVGPSAWRQSDTSDARWFWFGALVLLLVEQWLRRQSVSRKDDVRVAA